ncbi:ribonuclease PH [Thermobaculum terrenum ATCC BAA-798]|uniref:Ribonuclease PH n=1 Tax=Thermobaculum terrenum (strain ATCC BAA-798 / CCMEE 7001 / YNP1) TaxID=525904 RepID=D1CFI4_THET1|nr:ribonuclease PH [Thermobaculum terrenum]ACZ41690.1 ribonuclease PH [Thermobaculum terrenum ATCC BAA-798]
MLQDVIRVDGRKPNELRPHSIEIYPLAFPPGSAIIQCGVTKVLCAASIQEGVPKFLEGTGQGWLTAEYSMLPASTQTRTPRESHTGRLQGRTQEIQRLIGRSLRAAVKLDQIGEITIIVDCDVLQADGGTRTASITGGYVATVLALRKIFPDTYRDLVSPVAAVSVGIVNGTPMLDLNYAEDSTADTDLNVVKNHLGDYIEIQATAERVSFSREELDAMLSLADKGIAELMESQSKVLSSLDLPE